MADLPVDMLTPGPPFSYVGDDFLALGKSYHAAPEEVQLIQKLGSALHMPYHTSSPYRGIRRNDQFILYERSASFHNLKG